MAITTTLGNSMQVALATVFTFYLKVHNYHWNVTGPHFATLHNFFGEVYEEVWQSVDDYAEHLRAIDQFPSGGLTNFAQISLIQDAGPILPPDYLMIRQLEDDNQGVLVALEKAHTEAGLVEDYGLLNFLEDRLDYHKKLAWKLKAFSPAVM